MSTNRKWILICALGIAATILLFVDADVTSAYGVFKVVLGLAAVGLWIWAIVLGAGTSSAKKSRPPRVK